MSKIKLMLLGMTFIVISTFMNGCSLSNESNKLDNNDIVKANDKNSNNSNDRATEGKDTTVLITLAKLVGKSFDDVSSTLGTGAKSMNSFDNLGQNEYTYEFEGVNLVPVFLYNEDNILEGIYTKLPDYEPQKWEQDINKYLGTPTRLVNTSYSSENEVITILWRVENRVITLFGSHETLALLIE